MHIGPDYDGGSLANLAAEFERRLTGSAGFPGLAPGVAGALPDAEGYVIFLVDGLGSGQINHPKLSAVRSCHRIDLDAPFPATTTVSLSTLAMAAPPAQHGLVAYLMDLPGHGVVNTIKWINPGSGRAVDIAADTFLPTPNLWERLKDAGLEPVVIQPGNFRDSPLTRTLYRGCRFEPYWNTSELVDSITQLAAPGRLIVAYFPSVDYHAHVSGQTSNGYVEALATTDAIWTELVRRVPAEVGLVATGDHGHIDIAPNQKHRFSSRDLIVFGDPRAICLRGDRQLIEDRMGELPGELVPIADARSWWGPGPDHPDLDARLPDVVFLPAPGSIALPGFMDDRLVGYHGGLHPAEARIPLIAR